MRKQLQLKNNLGEMSRLAEEIEAFWEPHAVPRTAISAMNLALEELVTNVICYAFDDAAEHLIGVELGLVGDDLTAKVEDDGPEFDPLRQPRPDVGTPLEERSVGGLGILLVRKLMDEMTYAREAGRNVIRLRKRAQTEAV